MNQIPPGYRIERPLLEWVATVAKVTRPDGIVWCDGSPGEFHSLINLMTADGTLIKLNQEKYPNCYLHRSNLNDVARTEEATFICATNRDDAGPTNNWMPSDEGEARLQTFFDGCMIGRTMYVIPYLLGPVGSVYSQVGIELTDSCYVAVNMEIMTKVGKVAMEHIGTVNL